MEQVKLIEELSSKFNISYSDAKLALENSEWDLLDAVLYLERSGIIEKPKISIFYSNKQEKNYNNNAQVLNLDKDDDKYNYREKKKFNGIFETICSAIDICNNFFIEIKKEQEEYLKISLTVLILLLFFAFYIVIPFIVIALFLDIEFSVTAEKIDQEKITKANKVLKDTSKTIKKVKERVKKEFK